MALLKDKIAINKNLYTTPVATGCVTLSNHKKIPKHDIYH